MIPGVQKPHCKAPLSIKLFCKAWIISSSVCDSIVRISLSTQSIVKVQQLDTGISSINTVQTPHTCPPQDCLVPVIPKEWRRLSISNSRCSTSTERSTPLTNKVIVSEYLFVIFELLYASACQHCSQMLSIFRSTKNPF